MSLRFVIEFVESFSGQNATLLGSSIIYIVRNMMEDNSTVIHHSISCQFEKYHLSCWNCMERSCFFEQDYHETLTQTTSDQFESLLLFLENVSELYIRNSLKIYGDNDRTEKKLIIYMDYVKFRVLEWNLDQHLSQN